MTAGDTEPRSRPGWLVDEVATAGRENLDVAHVHRYDAKEDADAAAEVALLEGLGFGPSSHIVELGAGTGQFCLAAAEVFDRVVAVDVSPVMIERLHAKRAVTNHPNLEVVEAGFLTYDHHGPPADVVYTRFALHHLPDAWKAIALARMRDLLGDGGVLRLWDVIYDFEPDEADARLEAWCATGGDDVESDWSRAEIEEHVRDEHSTFRWLLEPMLERAGFTITDVEYTSDGLFGRYVARANNSFGR